MTQPLARARRHHDLHAVGPLGRGVPQVPDPEWAAELLRMDATSPRFSARWYERLYLHGCASVALLAWGVAGHLLRSGDELRHGPLPRGREPR